MLWRDLITGQRWGGAKMREREAWHCQFLEAPNFSIFPRKYGKYSGRFQTRIACHCMINKCVSSGECFFTYPRIFNWGLCCLCVPFFDPSWKQCRSRSKIPGYMFGISQKYIFLKIRTRGELQPTLVQRQLRQNLWQNLCTGQLLGWIGLSKRF